jgi:hypothetical protein
MDLAPAAGSSGLLAQMVALLPAGDHRPSFNWPVGGTPRNGFLCAICVPKLHQKRSFVKTGSGQYI